jgi:hypothetical protein
MLPASRSLESPCPLISSYDERLFTVESKDAAACPD